MPRYRCHWIEKAHYWCTVECEDEDYATDAIMQRHTADAEDEPKLEKLVCSGSELTGQIEHLELRGRPNDRR